MKRDATASRRSGRDYVSLRGRNNLATAYRGDRRAVGAIVVLTSEGPPGPARAAVVAGKGVGNAVKRNRAKRRLRAALERLALPDGMTFVVIARKGVIDAPFARLVSWLARATESVAKVSADTAEQEKE